METWRLLRNPEEAMVLVGKPEHLAELPEHWEAFAV